MFLLSTKENKKSIGDFKKQKRLWTRSKEDARRRTIHGKYIQQGQGGGAFALGGPLPKENDPIFKTVGKNSTN